MNSIKIKICGIRSLEAAQVAVEEGSDFLGFNFVKTSKRYIDPLAAKGIIRRIKDKIQTVGVFQNADIGEVNKITDELGLDFVQLHGDEDVEYIKKVKKKIIKKIVIPSEVEGSSAITQQNGMRFLDSLSVARNDNVEYLLLDRKIQGAGEIVNLNKAARLAKIYNIFFSGGLNAENVLDVIKKVKPFAVDVAGGIETNGKEDKGKIKEFIRKVRAL